MCLRFNFNLIWIYDLLGSDGQIQAIIFDLIRYKCVVYHLDSKETLGHTHI